MGAGLFFGALLRPSFPRRAERSSRPRRHGERNPTVRAHERPAVHAVAPRDPRHLQPRGVRSRSIRGARCTRWCRTPTRTRWCACVVPLAAGGSGSAQLRSVQCFRLRTVVDHRGTHRRRGHRATRSSWASRSQSLAWCSARSSRARPLRPRCIRTASAEHPARAAAGAHPVFRLCAARRVRIALSVLGLARRRAFSARFSKRPLAALRHGVRHHGECGRLPAAWLLAVLAIYPRLAPTAAALLAVAAAAALSLLLEAAQSYLPARVPTNLDVLCNIGGAALGAALAQHFAVLIGGGPLSRQRAAALLPGPDVDFGS